MAKAKKQSSRGRKQDRARVAGGQDYEVRYEAKKTGRSAASVKRRSRRSATVASASRVPSGDSYGVGVPTADTRSEGLGV